MVCKIHRGEEFKMKTFLSALFTLAFSQLALADTTYVCSHGDSSYNFV